MGKIKAVAKKFHLGQYVMIIVGTAILAFGIQCMYEPVHLVTGGFSGLAIAIKAVTEVLFDYGVPLWTTNLVLNVPVFIAAYVVFGKHFIGKSLLGTVALTVWLYVIPQIDLVQGDYLLSAVFGGVFSGAGVGFVLRANATTGGTDMVSAIIQKKFIRHYNVAQIMQVVDGMVVLVGLIIFGIKPTMYAIIAIFVTTKVSDLLIEGFNFSRAAFIITDQHNVMAKQLMDQLDRGVTGLHAKGMYTDDDKCVLYCVVAIKQIPMVKEIVAEIDPKAFVIVSDVREVLGEGFQEYQ